MKNNLLVSACGLVGISLAVLGCGSGSSAPPHCGQVEPCGGDVVGTWKLLGGCINSAALMASLDTSACPGETVGASNLNVSGSITFNADLTYTTGSVVESFTLTESLPSSCFTPLTCADVNTALQAQVTPTSGIQSVSCTGSSTCVCRITASANTMGESGTYSITGTTLTTTPTGTGTLSTGSYCVQQDLLHLVAIDTTMNTGPMGQATINSDIVGQRQ